jgi:hypothetical protein
MNLETIRAGACRSDYEGAFAGTAMAVSSASRTAAVPDQRAGIESLRRAADTLPDLT